MTSFPVGLLDAIAAGDAVLWTGSGLGALVDAPGWPDLLGALVDDCEGELRSSLEDLLEQGRLRPVFNFFARRDGDQRMAELLEASAGAALERELPERIGAVAKLPWRASLATNYARLLVAAFARGGKSIELLRHLEVHELSLREDREPFVLSSPLTSQGMRADQSFFDLVEEVVHTRTLLLVAFDVDDPDFRQVLDLLERVGRGRRHYVWMPFVSLPEARELEATHNLEVIGASSELELSEAFEALAAAVAERGEAKASSPTLDRDGAALDLARTLRGIPARADFALDAALNLDPLELRELVDQAKAAGDALHPRVALALGSALIAHGDYEPARRVINRVIARDPGPEVSALARFDLALLAAAEGDEEMAVTSLNTAAEQHRALALVPPRFSLERVLGRRGSRWDLVCVDRSSRQRVHLELSVVDRPVGPAAKERFMRGLKGLTGFDHAHMRRVYGGFADGQVFGLICEPVDGRSFADLIASRGRVSMENVFRVLGPIMDLLGRAHAKGLVHGNFHPADLWITADGPRLRGWALAPAVHYRRPSVLRAQRGYTAPELFSGAAPSPAADLYALGAVLYRALTGREVVGAIPPPGHFFPDLDPRLDTVVMACLHPDPAQRPTPAQLRDDFATMRTTPAPPRDNENIGAPAHVGPTQSEELAMGGGLPAPPMPNFDSEEPTPDTLRTAAMPEQREDAPTPPNGVAADADAGDEDEDAAPQAVIRDDSSLVRVELPEDPDDLEGWTWVLEQKPQHMQAREQVARIEAESREAGRWDRVADVLRVRAELSQVQDERVAMLRELADILEGKLGAPAFALETLLSVLAEVSLTAKVELSDDLLRLAGVTGKWAEVAAALAPVADKAPQPDDRARLFRELARIYGEELGAAERAHAFYVRALEAAPEDIGLHEEAAAFYRRSRMPIELAPVLLGLAELESGERRFELLLESAALLDEELEEADAALDTVETLLGEEPEHRRGREMAEDLARRLERWDALVRLLVARAEGEADDEVKIAALREAAGLQERELGEAAAALGSIEALLAVAPDDAEAHADRLRLVRAQVGTGETEAGALIDVLAELAERGDTPGARADALVEMAQLCDDAKDLARGRECRERLLDELPGNDPRVEAAVVALEGAYIEARDAEALRSLYMRRSAAGELPAAARIHAWQGLLKLSTEVAPDPAGARQALEALCELEPEREQWREQLLERYVADGESDKAAELVAQRAQAAGDVQGRAQALVDLANLRIADGKLDEAEAKLREALELDPNRSRSWARLAELLDQKPGQGEEAAQARVRAAVHGDDVALVVRAAQEALTVLSDPERAQFLLGRAIQLDPDNLEATEGLMRAHLAVEDLAAARPLAEARISQLERQRPDAQAALVETLTIAGRCALAAEDRDRAKELLAKARKLDATDLQVARLLADLQLQAGEFSAALNGYQAVSLGSGELEPGVQADLYMQMAACQAGLGQRAKELVMYQRALELVPSHEAATRGLVAASEDPSARYEALLRLDALLARKPEASEFVDERVSLLREAAELAGGALERVDDGLRQLDRALALTPADLSLLHAQLDLMTSHERWYDATEVLERIAELQDEGPAAAKYLYAGAVLIRDNVQAPDEALARMRKVLEADPLHEKAFRYTLEALENEGDAKEISRVLRTRLKALPDSEVEARVALFDMLGALYEVDLDDPKTALAAYEQAITLAGAGEDEERQNRVRRAYELALEMGDDETDKAIEMAQLVIARRPMDFDAYHALLRMFVTQKKRDSAVCVARALRFLKQANAQEMELANAADRGLNAPRGVMRGELWTSCLLHADHDPWLSELFAIIWAVVCARTGQTHAHLGLDRQKRETITAQSVGFPRMLAHACQTFDLPLPDLFFRPEQPGGAKVGALGDGQGVYPTVIAGSDLTGKQDDRITAFRAGRAAARVAPTNVLAAVLPSSMSLRDAIYGAVLAVSPGAEVPADSRNAAMDTAQAIEKLLPAAHRDHLVKVIERVLSRRVDPHAWLRGVEYTTTRAGFIMCDSLEMSARVLSLGTGDLGSVPPKDLIKDLVAYSVSAPYLRLRRELKQSQ